MTEDDIQSVPLRMLQMERYLWTILSMDMTAVIDLEGTFLDVNPGWKQGLGFSADDLVGTYLLDYLDMSQREKVLSQLQRLVTADFETTTLDFRFLNNERNFQHLLVNVAFIPDHECYYLVARSLMECGQERLVSAYHDVLTGLPNRYFLQRRLEDILNKMTGDIGLVAVLFIDLDGFKPVNDNFGHKAGDQVLQSVAKRLESSVSPEGFAARLGGDEFVVVVQLEDRVEQVEGLARRIMQVMRQPFRILDGEVTIGASIGISLYPRDGQNADTLLEAADAAMYAVKRSGKGGFTLAGDETRTSNL